MTTSITLPSIGDIAMMLNPDGNGSEVAPVKLATLLTTAETERQEQVLMARRYHEGRHNILLTERMQQWLEQGSADNAVRLNIVRLVNLAVSERLLIKGFDNDSDSLTQRQAQIDLAELTWHGSRMPVHQTDVHEYAVTEGEYFILVDWDAENNRPAFTPHPRYTDPSVSVSFAGETESGDGYGMGMYYKNGNVNQKPEFAYKRWTEYVRDGKSLVSRDFINLYFDNRIEKYYKQAGALSTLTTSWQKVMTRLPIFDLLGNPVFDERGFAEQDVWPLWWTDDGTENGIPLGIPVVHLKNPGLRPEAMEAWGAQDALNKVLLDMLNASDKTAFRLFITYGWKMLDANNDPLETEPNGAIGTSTNRSEAGTDVVQGANIADIRATIGDLLNWIAYVTDTPVSRLTGQVEAEGTIKEGKEKLLSKVKRRSLSFGMAYADAMKIARRLWNAFGETAGNDSGIPPELDTDSLFSALWEAFVARSIEDQKAEAELLQTCGATPEDMQRMVLQWTDDQIEKSRMMRLGMMDGFSEGQSPDGQIAPTGIAPTDAGIASDNVLNGAQITAALEVVSRLSVGEIAPLIAIELLTATGIPRDNAERMANVTR